jgi:hypothetical protein
MGEECSISTQNKNDRYEISITPEWIRNEDEWYIPVNPIGEKMKEDGTIISISKLHPSISALFGEDEKSFTQELETMIAAHYAFIIDKGLSININGRGVIPKPTRLVFTKGPSDKKTIRPFIFKSKIDGVEVFLAIGFTREIPSEDEVEREQKETQRSSMEAGWTILCNDRAVLYCDKTELTGWGEAGVPRYHTQFIAISGIVEFRCEDARKLPTTTTKRGIDSSSLLYLQIKNKMREGMQIFIDYTNKWKGRENEVKMHIKSGTAMSFNEIKHETKNLRLSKTLRTLPAGEQFIPKLPLPQKESRKRRISFTKDKDEIKIVATYLFDDEDKDASEVGEKCFDAILEEAKK